MLSNFAASLLPNPLPIDWRLVSAGAALEDSAYGVGDPGDSSGDIEVIGMKDIKNGSINLRDLGRVAGSIEHYEPYRLNIGDILLNRTNSAELVGKVGIIAERTDAIFASYLVRLRVDKSVADPFFLVQWLNGDIAQRALKRISTRAVSQANINPTEFKKQCPVPLPPLPEQQKIAAILRTWDEAIDACERRRHALCSQVDGLRLRLFEAAYGSGNETRQAKELFDPVSEKKQPNLPLLAVMQDIGVVRRDELDRRVVMPDGDTDGYKVVRDGDFVISLRSFEGGLEYSRVTGLVSPAYTVLRPNGGDYVGEYYRHYFKSRSFIGRLDRLIFGIRDGKQIAFRDFGDMKIPNPPKDEQASAANILGFAERQMELAAQEALALKRQKRGLMQKLLTGEWRVKAEEIVHG